jgi:hypothetical protein
MLHNWRTAVQNCSSNLIRRLTTESQMWFRAMREFTAYVRSRLEWLLLVDKTVLCAGCDAKSEPQTANVQSCNITTQHSSLCPSVAVIK